MIIGYTRTSRCDHSLPAQIEALQAQGCSRIFRENAGGSNTSRPELIKMLNDVQEGDTIIVWRLDRLGCSLTHLVALVNDLKNRGVALISLSDSINTATDKNVCKLFESLANFERALVQEHKNIGLSVRRRGGQVGRPEGLSEAAKEKALVAEALYRERECSVESIARQIGTSKSTLYRYLRSRGIEVGINVNSQ